MYFSVRTTFAPRRDKDARRLAKVVGINCCSKWAGNKGNPVQVRVLPVRAYLCHMPKLQRPHLSM